MKSKRYENLTAASCGVLNPTVNKMDKHEKLIQKILSGRQYQSIGFYELVSLLLSLGFSERTSGSHHIFYKENITEIINIQPDGSKAKPYQVRQIREIIVKYKLEEKDA